MTALRQKTVDLVQRSIPEESLQQVHDILVTFIKVEDRREETVDVSKRIGVGKGRIVAPDDFDAGNEEIAAFLMESAL